MTDTSLPGIAVDIPLPPAFVETMGFRGDARSSGSSGHRLATRRRGPHAPHRPRDEPRQRRPRGGGPARSSPGSIHPHPNRHRSNKPPSITNWKGCSRSGGRAPSITTRSCRRWRKTTYRWDTYVCQVSDHEWLDCCVRCLLCEADGACEVRWIRVGQGGRDPRNSVPGTEWVANGTQWR